MKLEQRELKKKDYKKAIQFAIKGMCFDLYMDNELLMYLYGKYLWYSAMTRATRIIALYADNELAGVLLAEIKGEKKKHRSMWKSLYVKVIDVLQGLFVQEGVGVYDKANEEMYSQYRKSNTPDGEIIFLVANPELKGKGIGSILLREFESSLKGKMIYLFTYDACTYQFYEHRGFERAGEKEIVLKLENKKVELQCLLYSKVI